MEHMPPNKLLPRRCGENRLKASLAYGISFGNQREEPGFVTGGTPESSGGAGRMVESYFTFWER